jgi:hypothetical protein
MAPISAAPAPDPLRVRHRLCCCWRHAAAPAPPSAEAERLLLATAAPTSEPPSVDHGTGGVQEGSRLLVVASPSSDD